MNRFLSSLGCILLGGGLVAAGGFLYQRHASKNIVPASVVAADTCLLAECLNNSVDYPVAQLNEQERATFMELGLEQLRLETVIRLLEERFGTATQPFATAFRLEQRQTIQFNGIFDKYGLSAPTLPDSEMGDQLASTKRAGCVQALDQIRHFEDQVQANRKAFAARPDIQRVLKEATSLFEDSLLPTFERCAKDA